MLSDNLALNSLFYKWSSFKKGFLFFFFFLGLFPPASHPVLTCCFLISGFLCFVPISFAYYIHLYPQSWAETMLNQALAKVKNAPFANLCWNVHHINLFLFRRGGAFWLQDTVQARIGSFSKRLYVSLPFPAEGNIPPPGWKETCWHFFLLAEQAACMK